MAVKRIGMALIAGAFSLAFAQDTCNDPQGVYAIMTSLGLGTMVEMKRLQPLSDFEIVDGKLAISAEGEARCAVVRNQCVIIKAMLGLQSDAYQAGLDPNVFSTSIYRQRLLTLFQRQQVAAQRPATDPNRAWAAPHSIASAGNEAGGCGGAYFLNRVSLEDSGVVTAAQLCSQMIFFGSQGTMSGDTCVSDNPYLDVSTRDYTDSTFTLVVDPDERFVNWDRDTLSAPIDACIYIDPTGSALGLSCECNGYTGTLLALDTANSLFSCRQSSLAASGSADAYLGVSLLSD